MQAMQKDFWNCLKPGKDKWTTFSFLNNRTIVHPPFPCIKIPDKASGRVLDMSRLRFNVLSYILCKTIGVCYKISNFQSTFIYAQTSKKRISRNVNRAVSLLSFYIMSSNHFFYRVKSIFSFTEDNGIILILPNVIFFLHHNVSMLVLW